MYYIVEEEHTFWIEDMCDIEANIIACQPGMFDSILKTSTRELYHGYTKYSILLALFRFFNLKIRHNMIECDECV